jgi:hypothetical protein
MVVRLVRFLALTALATAMVGHAMACGDPLTVNRTDDAGPGGSSDGNPSTTPDGEQLPSGADGGGGEDSGEEGGPLKFTCGAANELLCSDFEEASPLAKWTLTGVPALDTSIAAVSPTHSLIALASSDEVVTLNKDFARTLFPTTDRMFDVEFEFYLEASADGHEARIATLILSRKAGGSAGGSLYRLLATLKPGGTAFQIAVLDGLSNPIGFLNDAPVAKWSKIRLTAREQVNGSWQVTANYLGGVPNTQTINVTTPPTTVAYGLEIGADRGGLPSAGTFTVHFDNVRVRKL